MGEANQNRVTKILFPLKSNGHALQKFTLQNLKDTELSESGLDLTLRLSLGGWYCQNPGKKPLIRFSSLTRVSNLSERYGKFLSLSRSSSLPTETGQEQRRRFKELQKVRRIEAARRLMEKQSKKRKGFEDEQLLPRPNSTSQLVAWAKQSVAKNPAFRRALRIIKVDGSGNSPANNRSQKFPPVATSEVMPKGKRVKPGVSRSAVVITSRTMANGIPSKPAETEHGNPAKQIKWTTTRTLAIGIPSKPAETEHGNPSKQIKRATSRTMANGIPSKPAETEHGYPSKQTTCGTMSSGIPPKPAETEHGNLSKKIKRTTSRTVSNGTEHDNPSKRIKRTTSRTVSNGTEHDNPSKRIKRTTSRTMANGIPSKPAETEHGNPWKMIKWTTSGTMENGIPNKPAEAEHSEPSEKIKPPCKMGMRDDGMEELNAQMPGVTTTGPNGRTVEGFLYRYAEGQVIIICICHGNTLSPAEFVKHAGGTDMANPMKRIKILPTFF